MRASASKTKRRPAYMLAGTRWDVPTEDVLEMSRRERREYLLTLLQQVWYRMDAPDERETGSKPPLTPEQAEAAAVSVEALRRLYPENIELGVRDDEDSRGGSVTLKRRLPPDEYSEALRRLWETNVHPNQNRFLRTADDGIRNVLMNGTPAHSEHTQWAKYAMWRMVTKQGDLQADMFRAASDEGWNEKSSLLGRLDALLDGKNDAKASMRGNPEKGALPFIYSYLESQYNVRSAFPPFHAKFLADRYLPFDSDSTILDPCMGWGGRLLGSIFVNRLRNVKYHGVDVHLRAARKGCVLQ